jgi:hypothetical protein
MPAPPAGAAHNQSTHLRGVRVVEVETRRVVGVVVVIVLLVLAVSAIALTISAASRNSGLSKLHHQGVPVEVTTTGCVGTSSGIGMSIEYWECRGTYTLYGRSYNEVIRGSRALLQKGQKVPAVAVPGEPTLLSTVAAAGARHSTWAPYIAPIILGAVTVIVLVGWVVLSKRRGLNREEVRANPGEVQANPGEVQAVD